MADEKFTVVIDGMTLECTSKLNEYCTPNTPISEKDVYTKSIPLHEMNAAYTVLSTTYNMNNDSFPNEIAGKNEVAYFLMYVDGTNIRYAEPNTWTVGTGERITGFVNSSNRTCTYQSRIITNFEMKNFVVGITLKNAFKVSDMTATSITLKELCEHPNDYYFTSQCVSFSYYSLYNGRCAQLSNVSLGMMFNGINTGILAPSWFYDALSNVDNFTINNTTGAVYGGSSTELFAHPIDDTQKPRTITYVNPTFYLSHGLITPTITDFANKKKIYDAGDNYYVISDTGANITPFNVVLKGSYLLKILASFGVMMYSGNPNNKSFNQMADEGNLFIGEMDDNGWTTGRMITGKKEILASNAYNTTGHSTNFDPSGPTPGPTPGGDIDPPEAMDNGNGTGFGGFTSYFLLTRNQLLDVIGGVNSQSKAGFNFEYSIESLYGLAVPPSLVYTQSDVSFISISGGVNSNSVGATIKNNNIVIDGEFLGATGQKSIIDCGTKHINRIHGNFLDYEPYTTIELFIPLCGWVTLPSYCMDKDISVHYVIDGQNCSLTGICVCDGLNVVEIPGVFGVSVPFTATASGMKNAALVESLSTLASGLTAGALSFALGAKGGITGSMNESASEIMRVSGLSTIATESIKGISQTYVAEQGNYVRSVGNLGDRTAFGLGKSCYIRLSTVIENIPSHYGEEIGYIVDDTKVLNQCHGYTVISNPQFAGNYATETEVKMIEELMASGIILPGVDNNT